MKKLIFMLTMLTLSASAFAGHVGARGGYHHGGHYEGYRGGFGGWGWVAPAVVTGAVIYGVTRPPVVYVQPAPVLAVPGPYAPPYGFHWEQILDANCNCYRTVLVQG
jgi:hypothetical protein